MSRHQNKDECPCGILEDDLNQRPGTSFLEYVVMSRSPKKLTSEFSSPCPESRGSREFSGRYSSTTASLMSKFSLARERGSSDFGKIHRDLAALPPAVLHEAGMGPNISSIVAVTSTALRPDSIMASLIL